MPLLIVNDAFAVMPFFPNGAFAAEPDPKQIFLQKNVRKGPQMEQQKDKKKKRKINCAKKKTS